jgi:glucose-6-phosphate isomerase
VASKTFTTQETLTNAQSARAWLLKEGGDPSAVAKHFVAVSTNATGSGEVRHRHANMFEFWDWVGGRYSLWSAIGLPIMVFIGPDNFEAARRRPRHGRALPHRAAREEPARHPGAAGHLVQQLLRCRQTHAILPYDQYMHRFPAYFQQGDMESNGKGVTRDGSGRWLDRAGDLGRTRHQRPARVLSAHPPGHEAGSRRFHRPHRVAQSDRRTPPDPASNFFAQTEALMKGKTAAQARAELEKQGLSGEALEQLLPYKVFPGNRPSTSLFYGDRLTPAGPGRAAGAVRA